MGNNIQDITSLLHDVEIFSGFEEKILKDFSQNMKTISLKKGEVLFHKGDQDHAMYIILDGSVQIHDNEYIFTILNNKQFFGEYSLIDSAVRSATVTAVRDSLLLELKQEIFDKATKKNPVIWESVLIALIKRLRDYNILEEKLTLRTLNIQKQKYELEKDKESINSQKNELELINSTKDKFFTIIANDLKIPFSTIHKVTESLKSNFDNLSEDEIKNSIDKINNFSKNAYSLLDKLLQWAQSQTGSMKINFKRSNLLNAIKEAIELYDGAIQQKNLIFKINVDSNIYGYFDIDMVTTVFRNILANAVTHSKNNGIIFIIAKESNDMINIEVTDEGVGIEQKVLKSLFKIEDRQEMDIASEHKNTGLGLIICKEFILKNGGEIWVESSKEKGTTLKFTLPKAL